LALLCFHPSIDRASVCPPRCASSALPLSHTHIVAANHQHQTNKCRRHASHLPTTTSNYCAVGISPPRRRVTCAMWLAPRFRVPALALHACMHARYGRSPIPPPLPRLFYLFIVLVLIVVFLLLLLLFPGYRMPASPFPAACSPLGEHIPRGRRAEQSVAQQHQATVVSHTPGELPCVGRGMLPSSSPGPSPQVTTGTAIAKPHGVQRATSALPAYITIANGICV